MYTMERIGKLIVDGRNSLTYDNTQTISLNGATTLLTWAESRLEVECGIINPMK